MKTKIVVFAALMSALANVLSLEPFVIPIVFGPFASRIHLSQLPVFLSGCLAGPWAGLVSGAIGGIYMSVTAVPFIVGGLGLLGFSSGFLSKRLGLRPFLASVLAWCVQAVYVYATDYFWFKAVSGMPHPVAVGVVSNILIKLTVEAVISSVLVDVLILSIMKSGYYSYFT